MKTTNDIYFNQISKTDLVTMFNTEAISRKCLDAIQNRFMFYTDKEIAILDVGSMIAVVILETEEINHFNKFAI